MDNIMEPLHAGLFGIGLAVIGLIIGYFVGRAGVQRQGIAWEAYQRVLDDPAFAKQVEKLLHPPATPAKPSGVPVRLLAILQRDGRLLDFLLENIQGASEAQIAAAIKDLHPKCQESLKKHLVLAPVLPEEEGKTVEVKAGFDPSAIQLVGNVTGNPPFKGTLRHPGWRVKEIKLPTLPEGQDDLVLMPAEVEIV
jgi:hypothetical protein